MTHQVTVLIADDDAAFVKALSIRLEREGYRIVTATDGYFAVARAAEHKPDLLVLDIHMPAGDGFSVQERNAKIDDLADVPVIYISGDKSEQTEAMARRQGAFALMHKPFEIDELLAVIESALLSRAT